MDCLIANAMGLFTYYCVQGIKKIKMQLATHFRNCICTQFRGTSLLFLGFPVVLCQSICIGFINWKFSTEE